MKEIKKNKLKVISPFYNAQDFIEKSIISVLTQDYDNFSYHLIDDGSIDNSFENIKNILNIIDEKIIPNNESDITEYKCTSKIKSKVKEITLWRRHKRVSALPNWTESILRSNEDEIVCSLDADDFLYNRKVLSYINENFQNKDLWFMYGGCSWSDGRGCCSMPYTDNDFLNLRKSHFKVSMMRNFRSKLFHKIKELDPELSCFKDENKMFYKSACDVIMAYPLLEMAGLDRLKHNTKPVYIYNRHNPINDDKVNQQLQWSVHADILKKKPFKRLENL